MNETTEMTGKARHGVRNGLAAVLVSALPLLAAQAPAHHSFAAYFVINETITIEGVVTEWWFQNPHTRIYLEVTNEDGEVEEWMAEGGGRNVLARRGWSEETILPGTRLTIEGNPSRDGSNTIGWDSLTLEDGTAVGP